MELIYYLIFLDRDKMNVYRDKAFSLFTDPWHYICSFCFREALGFYLGQVAIIYSSNTSDACWTQTPSF